MKSHGNDAAWHEQHSMAESWHEQHSMAESKGNLDCQFSALYQVETGVGMNSISENPMLIISQRSTPAVQHYLCAIGQHLVRMCKEY